MTCDGGRRSRCGIQSTDHRNAALANPEGGDSPPLAAGKSAARWRWVLLTTILLVGGGLRLAYLDSAPPGWDVDEAANAWNAYCLLKTGMDQYGEHWPVFSLRAYGEHRTVWYAYCLLPFQAVGGMNLWTTRLPAALAGVGTLALMYWVGSRMFGRPAGLIAAAMLALCPWHIHLGRLGHEASLAPLQVLATLALALWAGFPLGGEDHRPPRVLRAALAGAFGGACCYGYFAVRLFLPLLLGAAVLLAVLRPKRGPGDRRAALALSAGVLAFLLVLGPLVVKHLTDREMNHRTDWGVAWAPSDPWFVKAGKVLANYPGHFGPDFLFFDGDGNFQFNPARVGSFSWYMLPLMLAGLGWCWANFRKGRSCQVLLLWLALFPVCDVFLSPGPRGGPSNVRSSPGLPALVLLGAVGAMFGWHWLRRQSRAQAVGLAAAALCAALVLTGVFADRYYRLAPAKWETHLVQHTEIPAAARYVRTRLGDVDAVVIRPNGLFLPYIFFVTAMEYDPREWFAGPQVFKGEPLEALKFGKFVILSPWVDLDRLLPPHAHRLLLVDCRGQDMDRKPVYEVNGPWGMGVRIYELTAEELRK
jgi:4-amino-4-deoxy-L-arabinose transferase-like glycosyltransferase